MRIFEEPNLGNGWKCPICETDEIAEVVLCAIAGTALNGIAETEQFHLKCIDLVYYENLGVLAMKCKHGPLGVNI